MGNKSTFNECFDTIKALNLKDAELEFELPDEFIAEWKRLKQGNNEF